MFSLRTNLIEHQGVTNEAAVKGHLNNCSEAIKANPLLRAHRYRVSANVPNNSGRFEFVA